MPRAPTQATNLEANYNRIHELRTRFKELLRDARIAQLGGRAGRGRCHGAAAPVRRHRRPAARRLCFCGPEQRGGDWFGPEQVARLQQIAQRTWHRHFDDTFGLSWEERSRRCPAGVEPDLLPITEPLLADKTWHVIPRPLQQAPDPRYRFQMEVPGHIYNLGELHNLAVFRGTLTE